MTLTVGNNMFRLAKLIAQSLTETEAQCLWFLRKFGTHEENATLQSLRDLRLVYEGPNAGKSRLTPMGIETLAILQEEEKSNAIRTVKT